MRKHLCLIAAAALVLLPLGLIAQNSLTVGSPVQQSPTRLDVATQVANCNVAVNNTCTATATPPGSNFVYIVGVDLEVCQDATGLAQTNVSWTTTNLYGAPILFTYSTPLTVDGCNYKFIPYNPPVKAVSPGTAVTVVSPAADTHAAYTTNIFWYSAPQ